MELLYLSTKRFNLGTWHVKPYWSCERFIGKMQLFSVRPLKQMLHKLVAKGLGHLRVGSRLCLQKPRCTYAQHVSTQKVRCLGQSNWRLPDCPWNSHELPISLNSESCNARTWGVYSQYPHHCHLRRDLATVNLLPARPEDRIRVGSFRPTAPYSSNI